MTAKSIAATAAAAAALLAQASPAGAQAAFIPSVIGNTVGMMAAQGAEHKRCLLNKNPAAPAKIAESQAGAEAVMRDYLRLAAASPSADVSAVFTGKAKMRSWMRQGRDTLVTGVEDPFAHAVAEGRSAVGAPVGFVRSGDGASALGLWRIEGGAGEPLGHYRVNFRREDQAWRITRMDLVEPPAEPDPVAYYCSVPGDSEAFAKARAERDAKRERKRSARAAQS
ncbi:MAG TPA: hypothetical protein VK403_05855 [Allosphingosinicella sp.]|nr:hypothetical protein [Allosphingosinicella sp.]